MQNLRSVFFNRRADDGDILPDIKDIVVDIMKTVNSFIKLHIRFSRKKIKEGRKLPRRFLKRLHRFCCLFCARREKLFKPLRVRGEEERDLSDVFALFRKAEFKQLL